MDKIELRIVATHHMGMRYVFRILGSKPFSFAYDVWTPDLDKRSEMHERVKIAQRLRQLHRETWQRYHEWKRNDPRNRMRH